MEQIIYSRYSSHQQDMCILELMKGKTGFFVDVGAGNGINGSNTLLLEKNGWSGICIEPNDILWNALKNQSQRKCLIAKAVLFSSCGEFPFYFDNQNNSVLTKSNLEEIHEKRPPSLGDHLVFETEKAPNNHASYGGSGLVETHHLNPEKIINPTLVRTVTLENLLDQSGAPKDIDLIDIDVEGSEHDILKVFDFEKYNVKIICVECAHDNKKKIHNLLEGEGFKLHKSLGLDKIYIQAGFDGQV